MTIDAVHPVYYTTSDPANPRGQVGQSRALATQNLVYCAAQVSAHLRNRVGQLTSRVTQEEFVFELGPDLNDIIFKYLFSTDRSEKENEMMALDSPYRDIAIRSDRQSLVFLMHDWNKARTEGYQTACIALQQCFCSDEVSLSCTDPIVRLISDFYGDATKESERSFENIRHAFQRAVVNNDAMAVRELLETLPPEGRRDLGSVEAFSNALLNPIILKELICYLDGADLPDSLFSFPSILWNAIFELAKTENFHAVEMLIDQIRTRSSSPPQALNKLFEKVIAAANAGKLKHGCCLNIIGLLIKQIPPEQLSSDCQQALSDFIFTIADNGIGRPTPTSLNLIPEKHRDSLIKKAIFTAFDKRKGTVKHIQFFRPLLSRGLFEQLCKEMHGKYGMTIRA